MDTTITSARAEVLRDRYRSRLPERLQELAGPPEGNVDLSLHIVWSGRTSYSLDRPKSRMTLYRTVLAEGLREDVVTLLHAPLRLTRPPREAHPAPRASPRRHPRPGLSLPSGPHRRIRRAGPRPGRTLQP
ncbi:hypothetical protein HFP71_03795 [Streptomyces sp. ARC32]